MSDPFADLLATEFADISTAPRDGTKIVVAHEDVGSFVMHWDDKARNALFAPGQVGMWVAPDLSMTWCVEDGHGPTHWQPLDRNSKAVH